MRSNASTNGSNPFSFWRERDSEATTTKSNNSYVAETIKERTVTLKPQIVTLKPQIQQCTPQRSFNPRSSATNGSFSATSTALQREGGEGRLKLQPANASSDRKRHPSPRPAPPVPFAVHHGLLNKDNVCLPARSRFSSSYSSSSEFPTKSSVDVDAQGREMSDHKLKSSSKSYASSSIPLDESLFGSVSLRRSSMHRKVDKVLSNPEHVNLPPPSRTTIPSQESKSTSGLESSRLRTNKFIPKVGTIRGSTGDQISMDDMEIYRLNKTGKVQDLAKQMSSVLLSVRQSSNSSEMHGSAGDINRMTRSVRGVVICCASIVQVTLWCVSEASLCAPDPLHLGLISPPPPHPPN